MKKDLRDAEQNEEWGKQCDEEKVGCGGELIDTGVTLISHHKE